MAYAPTHEKELLDQSHRDAEWECIKPHVPPPNKRGRPRVHTTREILDAVFFYVLKSGCAWRLLPYEFPPWETVYHYFRRWRIDGTWERLNATLRERLRTRLGRNARSSAGIVDSQSAKTTGVGGEQRGYDGGKKVRGILSVTCWWTQKDRCLKPRSTAPRSSTAGRIEVVAGVGVL